jgi:hypothetical protein
VLMLESGRGNGTGKEGRLREGGREGGEGGQRHCGCQCVPAREQVKERDRREKMDGED